MKVLLVQPPIEDFYDTSIRTYPLSLLYLGARLREVADVAVLDLRTGRKAKVLPRHPFPHLEEYYRADRRTPFSFFGKYYRFGCDEGGVRDEIEKAKPDVICVSSLFTTYAREALRVAEIAKETDSGIVTVMGGIHPTLFPRHVLRSPFVDYVIRGEGETPLFELVMALLAGRAGALPFISGLCYREGGDFSIREPHIEADLDLLPERRLVDPRTYRIGRKNYTFFLTSRGCPLQCAFCGRPSVPYRKRSMESVEREIEDCLDLGIGAIDFEDDMLNLDARYFGAILERFQGTGLTLSAMNGIYSGNLDTGTLERMSRAGFGRLNFSLVDISRSVMKEQKRLFPSNFLALLPYLEDSPFLVETHFIIGLPGQTPDEIMETMIFLMGRRLLPGPSIFYLAPGSPIFKDILGDGWEGSLPLLRSSAMFPVNPLLPIETLYTFMKLTRFINFVKAVVDRAFGPLFLSDLPALPEAARNDVDREIIATLCREKLFTSYDPRSKSLVAEPQDRSLVARFFSRAKGLRIKGFKSANTLTID